MRVFLVTPVATEFHAARETFGAKELPSGLPGRSRAAQARTGPHSLKILCTGAGRQAVLRCLDVLDEAVDLIIDSGSCGSLREEIPSGAVLHCPVVCGPRGALRESSYRPGPEPEAWTRLTGCLVETEEPVRDAGRRSWLAERFRADVCSMESFTVAEWADRRGIDWISLRIVTDQADEKTPQVFKKNIRRSSLVLYAQIRAFVHSLPRERINS